jgi:hypothetical protein
VQAGGLTCAEARAPPGAGRRAAYFLDFLDFLDLPALSFLDFLDFLDLRDLERDRERDRDEALRDLERDRERERDLEEARVRDLRTRVRIGTRVWGM